MSVTDVERSAGELHITLVQTDEPHEARSGCRSPRSRWSCGAGPLSMPRVWPRALEGPQLGLALDRELFRFRNPKFYPDARN